MAMLAYSCPPVARTKVGGGSIQQSMDYMYPGQYLPNASAGNNLLNATELIARPRIGGFLPSVMKGVVNAGMVTVPLAAAAAKRMMNNTHKRRGGGKAENWTRNRQAAKAELEAYGKPSALNTNKYAALKRKNLAGARMFLDEYKTRKAESKEAKLLRKKGTRKSKSKSKGKATEPPVIIFDEAANVVRAVRPRAVSGAQPNGMSLRSGKQLGSQSAALRKAAEDLAKAQAEYLAKKQKDENESKGKQRKKTEKSVAWASLMKKAHENLSKVGKPTIGNYSKYASAMRKGVETNMETIRTAVRARGPPMPPKSTKPTRTAAATAAKPSVLPISRPAAAAAAAVNSMNNITSLPANMPAFVRKQNKFDYERKQARALLSKYKPPTVVNVAKFVSLRRKATNNGKSQTYRNNAKKNLYTMLDKFKTLASTKKAKGRVLSPVSEEEENNSIRSPAPVSPPKTTRTRKVTNNWRRQYEQARANLKRLTGTKNPMAYKIAQLASIRRKGLDNTPLLLDVRSDYAPYRQ